MYNKMENKKITKIMMSLFTMIFLFVSSTETFASVQKLQLNAADLARHSNSLFQVANDFVLQKSTSEIWGRLRTRLDLSAGKNSPLYQKHLRNYARSQDYINKVVRNASPYLYYILEEVEKRGMPSEIALLPIIESDYNPHTLSNKGALGLWQLMPSLGHLHGLKQNSSYDGRKDIYESTKVALDHLAHLHKKFDGNWLLAIAAYNCGEGALSKAISRNRRAKKSTDFWSLPLPTETKHFVPKLLALATIIKSPSNYGVVLPSIPNQAVITRVKMSKPIDIQHAAKIVDVSETQLRRLNPGHKSSASKVSMHLVVPVQKASLVKASALTAKVEEPKEKPKAKKKSAAKKSKKTTTAKKSKKTKVAKKKSKTRVAKRSKNKSRKIHVAKSDVRIVKRTRHGQDFYGYDPRAAYQYR